MHIEFATFKPVFKLLLGFSMIGAALISFFVTTKKQKKTA
jgi:hypothetical protein|tara:strand:+ start:814 stop:933 length:120 start_codon:yes stop_codon:yes gene_type:complete